MEEKKKNQTPTKNSEQTNNNNEKAASSQEQRTTPAPQREERHVKLEPTGEPLTQGKKEKEPMPQTSPQQPQKTSITQTIKTTVSIVILFAAALLFIEAFMRYKGTSLHEYFFGGTKKVEPIDLEKYREIGEEIKEETSQASDEAA